MYSNAGLAAEMAAKLADDAGLTGDNRYVVVAAALLHDVGKPMTTRRVTDDDGSERIISPGHAEAGAPLTEEFLISIDCPEHLRRRIVNIVAEHMTAASTNAPTPRAVRRLARRLAPATMEEWAIVVSADRMGRGDAASEPSSVDDWLELARELGVSSAPARRLLRGDHLIAAGWKPSPRFKPVLEAAERAQDNGEFVDEECAVAWFERLYCASTNVPDPDRS